MSIKVNGYGRWCAQDKINNKQNSFVQNKYGYYDVINNYIQNIDDQRRKLLILSEESIENNKALNESYTNKNNGLTVIDASSEENVQDPEITQVENK